MDELTLKYNFDSVGHSLRSYDWDYSEGWQGRLADKLVPIVRQLYLDCEALKSTAEELGLDDKKIKEFIDKSLKDSIPAVVKGGVKNFQVSRSDFAEILAMICLEGLHDTRIPVKNIFYRELSLAPSRGIDVLGYEVDSANLALILCEVKGSNQKKSPPDVVHAGADSLKEQLYSYVSNKEKTLNRILSIHKKCPAANKEIFAKIALYWSKDDIAPLKVIVCPFLVRQGDCYKDTDFGFFKDSPDHFNPAKVRFLIVCVHEDLSKLSSLIYEKARGE